MTSFISLPFSQKILYFSVVTLEDLILFILSNVYAYA